MGTISPQKSWGENTLLPTVQDHSGDVLKCIEPEYELWIDPRLLRRMSRIIRMGVTTAKMALKEAQLENVDKIITGTGYGCLEDTGTFLIKMIENKEQALNPTPFIQSTHNTIGSQIGLILPCLGYNQTYSHGAFSFEHVLLDALLHVNEQPGQNILVCGVDEVTEVSHAIQKRFGRFTSLSSTLSLFREAKGIVNGEGAASFVVSGVASTQAIARVESVMMIHHVHPQEVVAEANQFLKQAGLTCAHISLVLLGTSGDKELDQPVFDFANRVFPQSSKAYFKHLCGEYPTASAFGVWLAAGILEKNYVPDAVLFQDKGRAIETVLIYNQYFGTHHSFMLLTSCRETL